MERLTEAGRALPRMLVAAGVALALVAGGLAAPAITAGGEGRRIGGFGLTIELPPGWAGAVSGPSIGPAARRLVASNATLPPHDRPLGERLTRNGARLVIWDYGGNLCPPDEALPIIRRSDLGERVRGTASYSFAIGGRLFRLVANFAGTPPDDLLAEANAVLRTLEIEPPADQTPRTAHFRSGLRGRAARG